MWQWISGLDANGWTAIFAGVGLVGIFFAAFELRATAKALVLDGTIRFLDELEKAKEDRVYVYNELPTEQESLTKLSDEDHKKVQAVIDALNRVGLLIENGLVSKRLALSIAHSVTTYHRSTEERC